MTHLGKEPSWERELFVHFLLVVTHPGRGPSWEKELFVHFSFVVTHLGKRLSWERELFIQFTFQSFFYFSFRIFYYSSYVLKESYMPLSSLPHSVFGSLLDLESISNGPHSLSITEAPKTLPPSIRILQLSPCAGVLLRHVNWRILTCQLILGGILELIWTKGPQQVCQMS